MAGSKNRHVLDVPLTRVRARIVVSVNKSDRGFAYASVSFVTTTDVMGTEFDQVALSKIKFTDLEPMKRRSDKRLIKLLTDCRAQIEARVGPIWALVKEVAFENGVAIATPEAVARMEESA